MKTINRTQLHRYGGSNSLVIRVAFKGRYSNKKFGGPAFGFAFARENTSYFQPRKGGVKEPVGFFGEKKRFE